MMLTLLLSMLMSTGAHAGSYVASYTYTSSGGGGNTVPFTSSQPPLLTGENEDMNGNVILHITATLTWTPSGPNDTSQPPKTFAVVETATMHGFFGSSSPPPYTASASDGFGTAAQPFTAPDYGNTCNGTYVDQEQGAMTVTLPARTLTATVSFGNLYGPPPETSFGVTYSVCPLTIQLEGATDVSGNQQALTGQQIGASVLIGSGGPYVASQQWSTSGGSPFKNWDPTAPNATNATQLVPLTSADMSAPNFLYYDSGSNDLVTVSCVATVDSATPDIGPTPPPIDVNLASSPVQFKKPTASWGVDPATITTADSSGNTEKVPSGVGFNDNSKINGTYGATTIWYPVTISVPSPFTGGNACFVQVVKPTSTLTRVPTGTGVATYTLKIMNAQLQWVLPGTGLDGAFPYAQGYAINSSGDITGQATNSEFVAGTTGGSGDAPTADESAPDVDNGGTNWTSGYLNDHFTTWLMYQPPNGVWVPLQKATWSVTGNATAGSANWSATGTYSAPTPADTDTFPSWTSIISGNLGHRAYRP